MQDASIEDAGAGVAVDAALDDPMAGHASTKDELRSLFAIKELGPKERAVVLPESFLSQILGADDPRHVSQGNRAIAEHTISRAACLRGLAGVEIQTAEQRAACGGAENMVPVHFKDKAATFCVDVFEFPNKACELPFVWVPPTYAKKLCELQGKRLCAQWEWQLACRGDSRRRPRSTLRLRRQARPHRLPHQQAAPQAVQHPRRRQGVGDVHPPTPSPLARSPSVARGSASSTSTATSPRS